MALSGITGLGGLSGVYASTHARSSSAFFLLEDDASHLKLETDVDFLTLE